MLQFAFFYVKFVEVFHSLCDGRIYFLQSFSVFGHILLAFYKLYKSFSYRDRLRFAQPHLHTPFAYHTFAKVSDDLTANCAFAIKRLYAFNVMIVQPDPAIIIRIHDTVLVLIAVF